MVRRLTDAAGFHLALNCVVRRIKYTAAKAIVATGTTASLAARGVCVDANANHPHLMIEIGALGKFHDLFTDDFIQGGVVATVVFLGHRPQTIIRGYKVMCPGLIVFQS